MVVLSFDEKSLTYFYHSKSSVIDRNVHKLPTYLHKWTKLLTKFIEVNQQFLYL